MKKTLVLVSLTVISLQTQAQQTTNPFFGRKNKSKHEQLTRQLLQLQEGGVKAQKPTAEKQRVIAQTYEMTGAETEYDSTRYTYKGTNGSTFDYNSGDYAYIDYFTSNYAPMFIRPYEATSQKVLADSILHYDDEGLTDIDRAYYRTDKKIDSTLRRSFGTGTGQNKTVNTFNAQGYLTNTYELNRNIGAPAWDTSSYRRYSYNSAFTQVSRDSIWVKVMTNMALREVRVYHYSTAGKLDSIITWNAESAVPAPENGIYIRYNSDGKIATIKEYRFDEITGTVQTSGDSLGYTPGVDYYTFHDTYSYEDNVLSDGYREVRFFNTTTNVLDSVQLSFTFDAAAPWTSLGTMKASYNSYNNPVLMSASFMGQTVTQHFYYELYNDQPVSVQPLTASQDFSVYPNPFTHTVNIDWKGKQPTDATVRLVSITGREVYQGKMALKAGPNKLDIPAVANGSYVLLIADAAGKSWSTKMVKR